MRKLIFFFVFCLLAVLEGYAESFDGVRGLVQRRAPWLAKHIQFEKSDAENECFTLRSKNGKDCGWRLREPMLPQWVLIGI